MDYRLMVMCSDAINKYHMRFSLESLACILLQACLKGAPSAASHDMHRPFGWSYPLGIFIEPGLARLVGVLEIPQSAEEVRLVGESHRHHLLNLHKQLCEPYEAALREITREHLGGDEKLISMDCAALIGASLAHRCFDGLFSQADDDGLIPLAAILDDFELLGAGAFKDKSSELVVFAHPYFRRSLSRLNTLNRLFLKQLIMIYQELGLDITIALDEDVVGYAPSFSEREELEYWWGPKFDDDIDVIKPGVTVHGPEEQLRLLSGINKTEFWWADGEGGKRLVIEEVKETPSLGVGRDTFGCRYIHALVDVGENKCNHFDGAIRAYDGEQIKARIAENMNKAGKASQYTKVFRIQGDLSIGELKRLAVCYFSGNPLPLEYFGFDDIYDQLSLGDPPYEAPGIPALCPYSIAQDDGPKIFVSAHPLRDDERDFTRKVVCLDTLSDGETRYEIIEQEFFELEKILRRWREDIDIPEQITYAVCQDAYLNLPLIVHGDMGSPANIQTTIHALLVFLGGLELKQYVSITISWLCEDEEIRLSVYGHSSALIKLLEAFGPSLPSEAMGIGEWLRGVSEWLSAEYPANVDKPPLFELVQFSGVLFIDRKLITGECERVYGEEPDLVYKLDPQLREIIDSQGVTPAPAWLITKLVCSACGSDFRGCEHSKTLDSGVHVEYGGLVPLAIDFWTDKPVPIIYTDPEEPKLAQP